MAKSTGYVLKERAYIGSATPPATFEDESRFGNDGVHTNVTMVQLPTGLWARSLAGDGYITIPDSASLDIGKSDFTLLLWFLTASTANAELFSKQEVLAPHTGYAISIRTTGTTLRLGISDEDTATTHSTSTLTLADSVWHQMVFSTDRDSATGVKGYFDTELKKTGDPTSEQGSLANAIDLKIGDTFIGQVALLSILNYALSAGKIKQRFEAERHWFGV